MLMRKTSAPESNRALIVAGEEVAGPSVARIFVLRCLRMQEVLVGEGLRPFRRLAGIDLKEAFAIEAAVGAMRAPDDRELVRCRAERLAAVPGSCSAIGSVEVVVTRVERRPDE